MLASSLARLQRFQKNYAPFVALALGCLARAASHRGVDFAPKAVGLLVLAWTLPSVLARFGAARAATSTATSTSTWRQRVARFAGTTVVVALFRNVLFFLVPIWFGSASVSSVNILFPIVLAAMALFSCFDHAYRTRVLERPAVRTLWTAVILFAALVPAAAVVASASPRVSAGAAAAIAAALAVGALVPRERLRAHGVLLRIVASAAAGALLVIVLAPVLPPVPVVCHRSALGTGVADRALTGAASRFPAGTRRLYGWFAVTLPSVYRQGINFQWYRDGEPVGRPIPTSVVGGRKDGFRTWSSLGAPGPGRWRVDVLTDADQLICRQSAVVDAAH